MWIAGADGAGAGRGLDVRRRLDGPIFADSPNGPTGQAPAGAGEVGCEGAISLESREGQGLDHMPNAVGG
jgi:hypothetical protein